MCHAKALMALEIPKSTDFGFAGEPCASKGASTVRGRVDALKPLKALRVWLLILLSDSSSEILLSESEFPDGHNSPNNTWKIP